ncbi:hypothetical protein GCM10010357_22100 [Streptomyces luteireticuli]|uniref:Terpene synthase n=1 Tax=Streptomyces luteireticuli TaxID=173858 RepID=A0ABN0YM79_9ACTN
MPETLCVHPSVQAARESANNVVAWANDLYSAPKELERGDLCNYVSVPRYERRCSAQEAAAYVAALITEQTARFHEAEAQIRGRLLPRVGPGERRALEAMPDTVVSWMNGNPVRSSETARYRTRTVLEAA